MKSICFVLCLTALVIPTALADIPQTMSYQGVLQDQGGQPIPNGDYQVTFRIYTVPSGGSALWTEVKTVSVAEGVFHTILGSSQPLNLGFDVPYWLGIRLGSDPEFTPRVALAAAPYALRAQVAEVGEDTDWTISGNNIYRLSGMVGIGTSTPQKRLHINEQDSGDLAYGLKLENSGTAVGTATGLLFKVDSGSEDRGKGAIAYERTATWNRGDLHILQDPNSNYDLPDLNDAAVTVKNNGNVGVGTRTPQTKLSVNGMTRIEAVAWPSAGTGMELGYSPGQHKGYVQVYDRDTDTWGDLFLGNGNVGIGNAYPAEKLQVNGIIYSMSGGIKFPDGTIQTTAGGGGGGGLTLPYYGTTSSNYDAFRIENTGSGSAIRGISGGSGELTIKPGVYGGSAEDNGVGGVSHTTSKGGVYGTNVAVGSSNVPHGYLGYVDSESQAFGVYGFRDWHSGTGDGAAVRGYKRYYSNPSLYCYGELGAWTGSQHAGVLGVNAWGSSNLAGYFYGDVEVNGWLTKPMGSFKIDHPLDPTNRNLYHSFVESPDMMNIYNGNVDLDSNGEAWVTMPEWFEALNQDFRYQLTPIGAPGPNLYVAETIRDNLFKIAGGTAGMTVSWQVTGIRHDPYADRHRIPVEEEKRPEHQGKYLHPEVYGMPVTMGVHYNPQDQAGAPDDE